MHTLRYSYWCILILIFYLPAESQDIYWIGGTGNWQNASNWSLSSGGASCSCLPGENDFVHIEETAPASIVTISNGDSATIQEIQVELGAQLHVGTSATGIRGHLEINAPNPRGLDIYGETYVFGSIHVYDATGLSVLVRIGGYLRIREGGILFVNKKVNSETQGITSRGTLILDRKPLNNPGIIELNNINGYGLQLLDDGITINNGRIGIKNVADNYGVRISATVVNDSTGVLDITDCTAGGISLDTAFTNRGLVSLERVDGVYGIACFNQFDNYRQINMEDCSASLNIFNTDTFINHSEGAINISGLTTQDGIRNLEFFENFGNINISGGSTAIAINNLQGVGYPYFFNKPCARIFITKMGNQTYFENAGLLTLTSSSFSTNSDILINKGILEDREGSYEPYNNITNEGVISHPLHGTYVLGIPSQGILLGPATSINSAPSLYFDSLQTTSAGAYSLADDEWLPNGFAGVSEIYTANSILGCPTPFVSKILLKNPIEATCPDPASTTIYILQQTDWFDPYDWSENQIPTPCFDASVLNGVIEMDKIGRAREFRVNPGSSLSVYGELEVFGQND